MKKKMIVHRIQLQNIVNDYTIEKNMLEHLLFELSLKRKSINSRLKLVKRKVLILEKKLNETDENDNINFSCDDFDDLDSFL